MWLYLQKRRDSINMKNIFKDLRRKDHARYLGGLDMLKYIGPGLLVTVGFIDPGNWASNFAAGSTFGYSLLWIVTLSTIMLIILQHNVAHLGIVTGLCLSEAATKYTPRWVSRPILCTAILASISTSLAEILGGAIALQMLLKIPIIWGSVLTTIFVVVMLFTNSYKKIERAIIAFVSVIGLSFIYELFLVKIDWPTALQSSVTPSFPQSSMLIIMSVLGAVVMPHNLFLHSEVIQSRQCNKQGDECIRRQLKYELFDTLFSMIVGWAINSSMILLAAATFFQKGMQVDELQQAKSLLEPLLGNNAAIIFALALLMAGLSSTITSGMAAGSIFAGMFNESYHIHDSHSQVGVLLSLGIALVCILFIGNPFKGLIISQMVLSIQLPFTVFLQVSLTSSRRVMGQYANSRLNAITLYTIATIVTVLNIMLFISVL
jgi:manganese transport protein